MKQKSGRRRCLTWVCVTWSGQVPEVVNEVQAVVVLHLSLGAQVGEQFQRLSTNLILSFCRHCPPASFWLVGHSGWFSTTRTLIHTHWRVQPLPARRRTSGSWFHPWTDPVRSALPHTRVGIQLKLNYKENPEITDDGEVFIGLKSPPLNGSGVQLMLPLLLLLRVSLFLRCLLLLIHRWASRLQQRQSRSLN